MRNQYNKKKAQRKMRKLANVCYGYAYLPEEDHKLEDYLGHDCVSWQVRQDQDLRNKRIRQSWKQGDKFGQ